MVVKIRKHLPFCKDVACFVLNIEFLLTVLSNFEREVAIRTQLFDR